jgi:hypothetical protein
MIVVAAAAMLNLSMAVSVWAESPPPSYMVLQPPALAVHKHHLSGYYPGAPLPVAQHAYAYGWFGSPPVRPQKMRHNGFRNDYSQWSFR